MGVRLPSWLVLLALGFVSGVLDGGTVAGPFFWWGMVCYGLGAFVTDGPPSRVEAVGYVGQPSKLPPPRKPRPLQAVVRWDSDTSRGSTHRPTTPHPLNPPPPKPRRS